MPRRPMPPTKVVTTAELSLPKEPLDQLVKGPMTQGELESMFRSLKKAMIERAMGAEMVSAPANAWLRYRARCAPAANSAFTSTAAALRSARRWLPAADG
jgi:hypothetical protein